MKAIAIAIAVYVTGLIGCSFNIGADGAKTENGTSAVANKPEVMHEDSGHATVGPQWEGLYQTASGLCSSAPSGVVPCSQFKDCLRIRKSSGHYIVELHSVQAYQNTCSAVLEMRNDPQGLAYTDAQGRKVWLRLEGPNLTLVTNGFNPVGYCGAHASLDGIEFPVASRQAVGGFCAAE